MTSALDFKASVNSLRLHALLPVCNRLLRFTSRATPADLASNVVTDTGRNEVLAKVIFSQVCVKNSVHKGGYLTRHPPRPGRYPPGTRHPPRPGRYPPNQAGTPPPGTADSGIRSTFGRYACYWNAFLFNIQVIRISEKNKRKQWGLGGGSVQ